MTDHKYEFNRFADIKRLEFILSSVKDVVPQGGEILDVGCGNGVISRFLGTHGYNVLGIDVSEKTILQARSLTKLPNVKFEVVSAEELAAAVKQYDAVICSEVLEHLHQPSKLLTVLHHSLKPLGRLIVTVPNGKGPREVLVTKPVQQMSVKNNWIWKSVSVIKRLLGYSGATPQSAAEDLKHIQFFSKKDLEALSLQNRFKIIKFKNGNFIDDVFPFSIIARRSIAIQKFDSKIADMLPHRFTGGFFTVWIKQLQ